MPDGYAVFFRRAVHTALFGGGTFRQPAIVFMEELELRKFLPSERQISLLKGMLLSPSNILSLTRAKMMVSGQDDPIKGIRLEYDLDDLWDAGYCICLGDLNLDDEGQYQYRLTEKGLEYAQQL